MTVADRLVPALQGLADLLTAAGVPASLDRAKVNPRGAWITAETIGVTQLDGSGVLRAHVFLVAPTGADDLTKLTILAGLLSKALTVLTPDEDVDTSYTVSLPHTPSAAFPAFRLVTDIDL
jgi:hypothetical protein